MECDNDTDLQSPIRGLAGILLVLTVLIPAYVADRSTRARPWSEQMRTDLQSKSVCVARSPDVLT